MGAVVMRKRSMTGSFVCIDLWRGLRSFGLLNFRLCDDVLYQDVTEGWRLKAGAAVKMMPQTAKNKPETAKEIDLYPPVKALFEGQGYEVKAEVGAADVVAIRGKEDPVVVELKLSPSLTLFHQCIERLAVTDLVYMAFVHLAGKRAQKSRKRAVVMARRLGIGVMTVRLADGFVQVHCDPGPYAPRKSAKRKAAMVKEFMRRAGDPNEGGQTRLGVVTSYRQDALKCAAHLAENGATKGADVARAAGVAAATRLMADNHYGWFERVTKGVYALTDTGREGLVHWAYSWEEG